MADVEFVGATRSYDGNPVPALDHLDLAVADGEFIVLVGPTGSGKSTALRMLAGLEDVDAGEIRIAGVDVSHRPPKDRDVAMVFQNYALYPHMTVAENMSFALKLKGLDKNQRDAKVREAARLLDLEDYLDRRPTALSGGQRQRVAMGRAIVRAPSVFLMDEPLSNLEARLRVETRAIIAALQERLGTTTLYVTHDQAEATSIGHRIAVLKDGLLQQVDTPRNLYDRPSNAFVAEFIGSPSMNLRTVSLTPNGTQFGGSEIALPRSILTAAATAGLTAITLGLRPESFELTTDDDSLPFTVAVVDERGPDAFARGTLPGDRGDANYLVVQVDRYSLPRVGETIRVRPRTTDAHAFNPDTGDRLN